MVYHRLNGHTEKVGFFRSDTNRPGVPCKNTPTKP